MRVEVAIPSTLVTLGRQVKGVTSVMFLGKIVIPDFHSYKPGWFTTKKAVFLRNTAKASSYSYIF